MIAAIEDYITKQDFWNTESRFIWTAEREGDGLSLKGYPLIIPSKKCALLYIGDNAVRVSKKTLYPLKLPLQHDNACPGCGKRLLDGVSFCSDCGQAILRNSEQKRRCPAPDAQWTAAEVSSGKKNTGYPILVVPEVAIAFLYSENDPIEVEYETLWPLQRQVARGNRCPNCGAHQQTKLGNFCSRCGQALLWL